MNAHTQRDLVAEHDLDRAIIVTGYACNLRCVYCGVDKLSKSQLSTEDLLELVTALACRRTRAIHYIGGEPFLRKDLGKIMQAARDAGMQNIVHSNGVFVRPVADAELNLVDVFNTCINGTPVSHDATRGIGTYEPALDTLRRVRRLGIAVISDLVLTRENGTEENIEHVLALARELDFRVNVQPAFEHQLVAAGSEHVAGRRLDMEALDHLLNLVLDRYDPALIWNSRVVLAAMRTQQRVRFDQCQHGRRSVVISPEGRVARCFDYIHDTANPCGHALGWQKSFALTSPNGCIECPYSLHIEHNLQFGARLVHQ